MLQQTQAARVAKAYPTFLDRFPTVERLAASEPGDVLRAWRNLGYNKRALNLWRAARAVVDRGGFPRKVAELERLPGVGPYTARAVASFAFGVDTGVVEANVRRIITRLHGLASDGDVQLLADELAPRRGSAAWNQALMDLGADVCRPRRPECGQCPLVRRCAWARGRREVTVKPAAEPFPSTMRYARGRIVAELRKGRRFTTMTALRSRTGLSPRRLEAAVRALERDEVVNRRGDRVSLGPVTSVRA
jgi:A/G-specific adenine glycosylase